MSPLKRAAMQSIALTSVPKWEPVTLKTFAEFERDLRRARLILPDADINEAWIVFKRLRNWAIYFSRMHPYEKARARYATLVGEFELDQIEIKDSAKAAAKRIYGVELFERDQPCGLGLWPTEEDR